MKKAAEKYRITAEWGFDYSGHWGLRYYTEHLVKNFFGRKVWRRFGNSKGYTTQSTALSRIQEVGPVGIVWESEITDTIESYKFSVVCHELSQTIH